MTGSCPESHPDDIGLPHGPLHFVSADRAVPQFTTDELSLIAEGLGGYLDTAEGLIAETTAEVFRQLRTKAASLAFMEVSRDA